MPRTTIGCNHFICLRQKVAFLGAEMKWNSRLYLRPRNKFLVMSNFAFSGALYSNPNPYVRISQRTRAKWSWKLLSMKLNEIHQGGIVPILRGSVTSQTPTSFKTFATQLKRGFRCFLFPSLVSNIQVSHNLKQTKIADVYFSKISESVDFMKLFVLFMRRGGACQ